MKLFQIFLEVIGWLQITIGTTLIGALAGALFYYFLNSPAGTIFFISFLVSGFVIGVVWATRIWIKTGTINWLSRIRRIK